MLQGTIKEILSKLACHKLVSQESTDQQDKITFISAAQKLYKK